MITYRVDPVDADSCRLVAKLTFRTPSNLYGWVVCRVLPLGDLVMMRRQLLNLRDLAERDARELQALSPTSPRP